MSGDSKILTLSYAGFTCALEGFADPFSLAGPIAAHFREAEARGSAPEAAVLQRIAEGAVLVAADAAGVTLRAAAAAAPEPAAASVAARLMRLRAAMEAARHPTAQAEAQSRRAAPQPMSVPAHREAAAEEAVRAFVAAERAEQAQTEARERAQTLARARSRIGRLKAEPDPQLLEELARIEQELATPCPAHDAGRQLAEATGEDAVERILDKTRSQMGAPESRRRISALSHLKAAVAATVAERLSGGPPEDEGNRLGAYRDDLARVVRPGGADGHPPPLLLGLGERVDPAGAGEEGAAAPRTPPRP
ncbi:hypothetical protein U5903_10225 [Cereibacter johrii]|uniref:hypothetical protein n=1 Tax=Cereibacter johrii TaxID=445629 RepID=UPI002B25FB0D|nr:hypothetical protein [Cereibacter johrii]MEA5161147.1 hypothetical protein [Cereibacter johrii]